MGRAKQVARGLLATLAFGLVITCLPTNHAQALVLTQNGAVNVSAQVLPTTPTEAAIIDQPQDNIHLQTTPLVVMGRCGAGLLVRIFDNGLLAGSVTCAGDSTFIANITLVSGKNVLSSLNYDAFDQPGPGSPNVTVYVDLPTPVTPGSNPAKPISQEQELLNELFGPSTPVDPQNDPLRIGGGGSDSQHIFEGTFVEPIVKVIGANTPVVPASVNHVVNTVASGVFILGLVTLGALLLL